MAVVLHCAQSIAEGRGNDEAIVAAVVKNLNAAYPKCAT